MKKMFCMLASLSLVVVLNAGCHTVQGAGKDLEKAGKAGQETIDPAGQRPSDSVHQ